MSYEERMQNACRAVTSYLGDIGRYTAQAARDFRENPVEYTGSCIKDFVKQDWDLGLMMGLGLLFKENPETLPAANMPLLVGSLGTAMISQDPIRRFGRNFFGGIGVACFGIDAQYLGATGLCGAALLDLDMRVRPGNLLFLKPKEQPNYSTC